jgi:hypothetical protein
MHSWTAGKGDLDQKDGRSNWAVSTFSLSFSPEPWKTAFPSKLREIEGFLSQSRATHRVSQCASLFLGLGFILRSYHMRELLVCWLCFSIAFVLLTLVILAVVLACYAGRYFIQWASAVVRVTRLRSLTHAKLSQNEIYLFSSGAGIVGTDLGSGSGTTQPYRAASPIAAHADAHLS